MKSLTFFLFVLSASTLIAQSSNTVEKSLLKVNALMPGIAYELGVGKKTTFNFEVTIVPISQIEPENLVEVEIFPVLGAEFRYYNNIDRRLGKGKNISGNSANYLSFVNQAFITTPILGNIEFDEPIAYLGGVVYGFQRTYKKGFYFNLAFGPAFFTGDGNPAATIYLDARIGWVIGKRKK